MLDGLKISGYRSFGNEPVVIPDLQKVNIFIGKNNCGKSNVLRFVNTMSLYFKTRSYNEKPPHLDPLLDFSLNTTSKEVVFGIQTKAGGFTDNVFQKITEPFGKLWPRIFPNFTESIWFDFHLNSNLTPVEESVERLASQIRDRCNNNMQQQLTSVLCNYSGGSPEKRCADIAKALHSKVKLSLNVHMVDAFRRITDGGGDPLSGSGLIKELRKLQSPTLADYDSGKARFNKIVCFLRSILGEPTAELEIPAEKDEIYVTLNEKVLPLDSLGTGIHELIIIASAVTLVDKVIFCIEEPEIHLHPELKKKFIDYIGKETNNQYLIASHSNSFFDLPGVNIYSCQLQENTTKCKLVSEAMEKHALLMDLGYRPSDLLQANYVIWVEGPSDRVYLKHWIQAKAPDLIEGLHYSIMFYGGRLLAHLAYDSADIDDFINLSRLNRNACILIDSDRDQPRTRINRTKQRVKEDFERNVCMTWVTKGRTIENYVPESVFNHAVSVVHPRTKKTIKWSQYGDLTHIHPDKVIDKVAVARVTTETIPDFSVLDLNSAVEQLVSEIRKNNSIVDCAYQP